ncbi:hypothetical protein PYCCODRAFT_1360312 [Trametes coccinea BRFM310]|uniref:Uncharacterized protein n=1 Tax=Trametes coccinea (strain BRFM310) TaxID=1353009 RepID=A0A1Y2IZU2_TRAC3|nr:hypothetical protein PYCCODRAFT_1360312 [Trametes coccinea BRFM310]
MATPSSSATTPSPRPRYLHSPTGASSSTAVPNGTPVGVGDDRERVVQKLRTQAELNKLALNLRARLSYANFKVKNNSTNNTLLDLDSQLSAAAKHSPNGKTPSKSGTANFFGHPGSPGSNAAQASRAAARRGSMAPPPPVTASAAQSLFSSLLAPPPAKRARTIHNPDDPPIPAPEKGIEHTRSPLRPTRVPRTPDSHAKSKSKKGAKDKAGAPSSAKGKGKAKQRVTAQGSFEPQMDYGEGDIDVEAAKTLTHFLLAHRPSVSATAGSPRSSISAGSDAGSTQSFPHYAQSATRTMAGGSVQDSPFATLDMRSTATPPHSPALSQPSPALSHAMAHRQTVAQGSNLRPEGSGTPKMTPRDRMGSVEDTDAAGMLLLMATSPSPARPTSTRDRDARDAAAFHALRGGGSGLKGRVLFPSYGSAEGSGGGHSRTLSREMSGSFASISSAMTEPLSPRSIPPGRRVMDRPPASSITTGQGDPGGGGGLDVPMMTTITPPTPTEQDLSQLVPTAPASPRSQGQSSQPMPHSSGPSDSKPAFPPHTPNASFSLSDYVNVSPSPAAVMHSQPRPTSMQPPPGRRLFEGHTTPKGSPSRRSAHPTIPPPSSPSPAQKSGLSAGVDLA